MLLTLLLVIALQRAKKPVVDTGVPRGSTLTSAFCRLGQLVEVQGYESHAEAARENDRSWLELGTRALKRAQYEM